MHHFLRIAMNFSQYFECIQEWDFGGLYIVCSELALALDRPLAELIALSKRTRLEVRIAVKAKLTQHSDPSYVEICVRFRRQCQFLETVLGNQFFREKNRSDFAECFLQFF